MIHSALLRWFESVRRELPWRETRDPYLIWISEIILQQTRVAQGLAYYQRFVERFPDVRTLALASEDEVLRYWQGLGYYSRARNLHASARIIMNTYGGVFPREYAAVRRLRGIGDYTAAAICSFAYNDAYAVLDGNVYRVLARFFGENTAIDTPQGKRLFQSLATEWLNRDKPAEHNQALMELGALCCTPTNPDCINCPLQAACVAYAECRQAELPARAPRKELRNRYLTYIIYRCQGKTLIYQRQAKDIWQHLYEFPLIESDHLLEPHELPAHIPYSPFRVFSSAYNIRHTLSHQQLYARFYVIETERLVVCKPFLLVEFAQLDDYACSRLTLKALERLFSLK